VIGNKRLDSRAVEVGFKNLVFYRYFKNLKISKSPNFRFIRFLKT